MLLNYIQNNKNMSELHYNEGYPNRIPLKHKNISDRKIRTYYIVSRLILPWVNTYEFLYTGEDLQLLYEFTKKNIKVSVKVHENIEEFIITKPTYIIVDDNTNLDVLTYIFSIMERGDKATIVLFLNNEDKYLFYQPYQTDFLKYILPYSFICSQYDKEGGVKVIKEEFILYPYTQDDELRKSLITAKIDLALKNTRIEKNSNNIENLFLRGMLEAVERRTLYLMNELNKRA